MTRTNVWIQKDKTAPFHSHMSKNDISHKLSIFATPKNWLDIFKKSSIKIEAKDYIYYSIKLEIVLIEVLQWSSKREKVHKLLT